jgi:hypothetical protein
VVIPLYVPPLLFPAEQGSADQWTSRETVREEDGATLKISEKFQYDWSRRLRVATLRYEVIQHGETVQSEERLWVLRWYSQGEFRRLLLETGFDDPVAVRENHKPSKETDPAFVFLASRRSAT